MVFELIPVTDAVKSVTGTFAGSVAGYEDGEAVNARFNEPFSICLSTDSHELIIGDCYNRRFRALALGECTYPASISSSLLVFAICTVSAFVLIDWCVCVCGRYR